MDEKFDELVFKYFNLSINSSTKKLLNNLERDLDNQIKAIQPTFFEIWDSVFINSILEKNSYKYEVYFKKNRKYITRVNLEQFSQNKIPVFEYKKTHLSFPIVFYKLKLNSHLHNVCIKSRLKSLHSAINTALANYQIENFKLIEAAGFMFIFKTSTEARNFIQDVTAELKKHKYISDSNLTIDLLDERNKDTDPGDFTITRKIPKELRIRLDTFINKKTNHHIEFQSYSLLPDNELQTSGGYPITRFVNTVGGYGPYKFHSAVKAVNFLAKLDNNKSWNAKDSSYYFGNPSFVCSICSNYAVKDLKLALKNYINDFNFKKNNTPLEISTFLNYLNSFKSQQFLLKDSVIQQIAI